MNAWEEDGLSPERRHPIPRDQRRHLYLYLLPMIVVPVLLLLAAFWIVPTRWFTLHSGNTYMMNIGYADTLSNSDCKIVIYGDSTAMTSVDPLIIQARTGLKACNIAEFEGMTSVNQTMLVDKYLARNPRPEFMVFMYTPEDLGVPQHWNKVSSFEAVTYRVAHGMDWPTLLLFLRHPADSLGWAEQGMRMTLFRFHTKPMGADKLNLRDPYNGQLRLDGETLKSCPTEKHSEGLDPAWVAALRARYGVGGTKVIVDATPAPPCDVDLALYQKALPGIVDDTPYPVYPINYFLRNTRLHMNETGSGLVSTMIANQIYDQLHAPSAKTAKSLPEPSQPMVTGGL
jgi:hypothetical protein